MNKKILTAFIAAIVMVFTLSMTTNRSFANQNSYDDSAYDDNDDDYNATNYILQHTGR